MPSFLLALLLAAPAPARSQPPELRERVQRIAFTLGVSADEYQEGVAGGKVVAPVEYEEAVAFLAEARSQFERAAADLGLDPFDRDDVDKAFRELDALIREKGDPGQVRAAVARLGVGLGQAFGVSTEALPGRWPSVEEGRRHYEQHCVLCHGEAGDGRGPASPGLRPQPPPFTDAAGMARSSPIRLFRVVTVGVPETAMVSWAGRLDEQARWDVVAYLRSFALDEEAAARGRGVFRGAKDRLPAELLDPAFLASSSDEEILPRLSGLASADRRPLLAFLRLSGPEDEAARMARRAAGGTALAGVRSALARALEYRAQGRTTDATDTALEAYLRYEPVEARAAVSAPAVNARLEAAFPRLRTLLASGAEEGELREVLAAIEADLARLEKGDRPATPWTLFLQALFIILREGFEAILILGALAAYLRRSGHADKLGVFYRGAWAGVAASLLTAWALSGALKASRLGQEALEGLIMLSAAAVLAYVSSWLLWQADLRRWNAFIRGRMQAALSDGRLLALAFTAFLAVYREGFETVLFYKALLGFSEAAATPVFAGLAVGTVALAAVFWGVLRFGMRVPLRPYFAATSALLFLLAFSFVGQGIAELQEAGWLAATPLAWAPRFPALGLHPTIQTLSGQALLLAAAAAALAAAYWIEPAIARRRSRTHRPPLTKRDS